MWHADSETLAQHRSKVANHGDIIRRRIRPTKEGENAIFGIGAVDPLESLGAIVARREAGDFLIKSIKVAHDHLDTVVIEILK